MIPGGRYGRTKQALALCPFGRTKFWQLQQAGEMVKPVCHLSPTLAVYDLDAVEQCVGRLIAAAKDREKSDHPAGARNAKARGRDRKPGLSE